MKKYRVFLLLIICNLFWAGNYVFGKYVVSDMTPLWITFSRWLMASFLLIPIAYFTEKPKWDPIRKQWFLLFFMGISGIAGFNLALYSALHYTSPTNASLISALNPGLIVLVSVFMLREKVSLIQVLGFIFSLLGVFLVLTRGHLDQIFQTEYNRGDLIMIISIVVWTVYSILGKRLRDIQPITATAVSALFGTIIMAPFALYEGINIANITPIAVTGILYMIIFPSIGSFILWNMAIQEIGASKAGIFLNFIPIFTAIISWILGEKVTAAQVCGGILVFIGVYLTTGMLEARLSERARAREIRLEER
ncbi:DMT family transporter [Clostridium magnum]|uniref:Putative inner membrane transporter YhbE n=1 Tax=Clostridium magnum DSM 2767 TaxID=1121326 RepID=A0A162RYM6_9CLOT|nr:DMT family transporter [Clostridium magnum]KZL90553.1 putative inner membrane transporter YhbE [Clostridium magnum DSM 2767]SHI04986.1 Permease of the drug/metabolite transporter (DMT) superfamily [Clostridium magnum DSM 2767]